MRGISIADITSNYREQVNSYCRMLELASQQLELAEKKLPADNILAERHHLMEEISTLNAQNQECQKAFCQSAGIETFNISSIKSIRNAAEVEELSQVLKELAEVLQQIAAVDKHIHALLNQQLAFRHRPRTTPQRAQQSYRESTKPQN